MMIRRVVAALLFTGCATGHPQAATRGSTPLESPVPLDGYADALALARHPEIGRLAPVFLVPGTRRLDSVTVQAGTCVVVAVDASEGVRDADLRVYARDGTLLAEDRAPSRLAIVRVCANETPIEAVVVTELFDGAGTVQLRVHESPAEREAALVEALGPRPPGAFRDARGEQDPLVGAWAEALRQRGFDRVERPRSVAVPGGEPLLAPVPLGPGECVTAIARTTAGLRLRLVLSDPVGRELASDEADDRDVAVQRCAPPESTVTLALHAGEAAPAQVLIARGRALDVGGPSGLWLGRRNPD